MTTTPGQFYNIVFRIKMPPSKDKMALSEFLIEEVRMQPCLWLKTSEEYKNLVAKYVAWRKILQVPGASF
jgi:hypothetical protein